MDLELIDVEQPSVFLKFLQRTNEKVLEEMVCTMAAKKEKPEM